MQYVHHYSSPVGDLTIVSDGEELFAILFDEQSIDGSFVESDDLPIIRQTIKWLDIYFSGKDPGFIPKLHTSGTPFQTDVWKILQTIPFGKTMSYGEIARMIAKRRGLAKMSAQAVGNAVGANPISIIVPCHRVIGSNGNLVGYGGGLDKKVKLLEIEGIETGQRQC